jgi:pyruvate,water dikinase
MNSNPTDSFPLNWQQPEDSQEFWLFYGSYLPEPFTPLESDMILATYIAGFDQAFVSLQAGRYRVRFFNGYWYVNVNQVPAFSLEEKEKWKQETFATILAEYTTSSVPLTEWALQWPAEVKHHLAEMDRYDFSQPLPQLLSYLEDTLARCARISFLHMRHQVLMLMAVYEFENFYQDLFGKEGPSFHQLLQIQETYALRSNRQLWRVSRQLYKDPASRERVLNSSANELLALRETAAGQPLWASLSAYLAEYGKQSESMFSLRSPAWVEDPTPVLLNLKALLAQPERDLDAELRQKQQTHWELIASVRAQLASYPEPVVRQFERLLEQGQKAAYILDEHTYWMELALNHHQRQIVLALGEALQKGGALTSAGEIFYLRLAELRALATAAALPVDVGQRQAELHRCRQLKPPPFVGTPPTGHPPANPVIDVISHHALLQRPVAPTEDPQALSGYAASPGCVTGAVRILRSINEVSKLQPGDILVTAMTTPIWTSVFMNVAGIITDNGGMLSHAAIVAREMGIPAVVGTGKASRMLQDGQIVTLDGTAGQVRIL